MLSLQTSAFYLLVSVLAVFVAMLLVLRQQYPGRKRGLEGYMEAAGIDLAFFVFALALVVGVTLHDPMGNRTSLALYRVVLGGYWLTFAVPVVTIGSSVHARSRGSIPWLYPSLAVAALLFAALFGFYYSVG